MVLLLHGAIRFFVVLQTFTNHDDKHQFHLKEYSILQLLYASISRLSYSESDILSVTHVLGYNIVRFGSVLHTLLKLKNKGIFYYKKKH